MTNPAVTTAPLTDVVAIQNYQGQFSQQIIGKIYNQLNLTEFASVIPNLRAPRILSGFTPSDGVRPDDIDIEDTNFEQGSFKLRTIAPERYMKILKIRPGEFVETFYAESLLTMARELPGTPSSALANVPGATPSPSSLAQVFWENQTAIIGREIANNHYFGQSKTVVPVYSATTAYVNGDLVKFNSTTVDGVRYFRNKLASTGVPPMTGANINTTNWVPADAQVLTKGWGTIIKDEILGGGIAGSNLIPLGALSTSNAFQKIDNVFFRSIPEEIRLNADKIQILMSDNTFEKRRQNLLALNQNTRDTVATVGELGQNRYGFDYVHGSNRSAEIRVAPWMIGSDRIIANIHYRGNKNLAVGYDAFPTEIPFGNNVPMLNGYKVKMAGTLAFQVADLEVMFVNELA